MEPAQITPEAYFITDLGVDSLRLLGLMLQLEKLGFSASLETVYQMQTVEEAYHFCRQQVGDISD